jgi:DNA modification methylase
LEFVQQILNINEKAKSVYDPFGWTWTTLIACEQMDRECYSMELDAKYCEVIIQRFHNLKPNDEIKCLNREIDFDVLFDE